MAGPDPKGSDGQRLDALARQISDLERQTSDLNAAIQKGASVRKLLTLVVAALLAVFGYLYYTTGRSFMDQKNLDKLILELQLSATSNEKDVIKQAQILVEHCWPTVSQAMNDQLKQDMPAIMNKLGTERENLAVNLRDRLEGQIRGKYRQTLDQHRVILKEMFPSAENDEAISAMIGNFEGAFEPLVKQYYGDKLRAEFEQMYKTWDDFPLDNSKRNREELADDLYKLMFQLMQTKLSRVAQEEDRAKSTTKAGGGA